MLSVRDGSGTCSTDAPSFPPWFDLYADVSGFSLQPSVAGMRSLRNEGMKESNMIAENFVTRGFFFHFLVT